MSRPILITVPKYVAISPNPVGMMSTESYAESVSSEDQEPAVRGKKRRLDHLSWEEKVQRKKLKNRVAAQTSRDRKKAKMDDMEQTIADLTENSRMLQNKCENLELVNQTLMERNTQLDMQVEYLKTQLEEMKTQQQQHLQLKSEDCVKSETKNLKGSAVSENLNPLPKGSSMGSEMTQYNDTLWKIIALCLLYKTCSKISTPPNWKNLPKAYSQISHQMWKEAIMKAKQMLPKIQAKNSNCLDQWWGPQQKSWNPANIARSHPHHQTVSA